MRYKLSQRCRRKEGKTERWKEGRKNDSVQMSPAHAFGIREVKGVYLSDG